MSTNHCDCGACDPDVLAIAAEHDAEFTAYCVWPDGTWCEHDELSQMTHMGDDYGIIECAPDAVEYCVAIYLMG